MKKSSLDFHDLLHKIREQLNAPVDSETLHEIIDALMRRACARVDSERAESKNTEGSPIDPLTDLESSMLEQLTEICWNLTSDETSAAAQLRLFIEKYHRAPLPTPER
jgi:hypothetical protein